MTTNRGTYRFHYNGTGSYESWLDGQRKEICLLGLNGFLLGDEDEGFLVIEGSKGDIDTIKSSIQGDPDTDDFVILMEEFDVPDKFKAFREFVESNAKKTC